MLWSFGALDRSRKISTSRHPCCRNVVIWPSQSQENVCFGSAHKPVEGPTVSLIGTLTVCYIKRLGFGLVGVSKNKSEKIIQLPYLKDIAKLEWPSGRGSSPVSFQRVRSRSRRRRIRIGSLRDSSLRKQPTFATPTVVSPPNDVWEARAEIPYWWRVTTQIWVMLLIGRAACEICFNQSEALPRSG